MKKALFVCLLLCSFFLSAWETAVRIDGKAETFYSFTLVRFDNTNTAYILYRPNNQVLLATYDGEKVKLLGPIVNTANKCYSPWMAIGADNTVHLVWAEAKTRLANDYYIKYRTYKAGTWSDVSLIAKLMMPGMPQSKHDPAKADYMRCGVDSSNNLFITYYDQTVSKCKFISKYGNVITKEGWPNGSLTRMKFPDLAVADDYVHVVWQHSLGAGAEAYTSMWCRRENKLNGKWLKQVDIKQGRNKAQSSHNPIMSIDNANTPHFIYMDDGNLTGSKGRDIIYKYWTGATFSEKTYINSQTAYWSENNIAMHDRDNGFMACHSLSGTVFYDWKVDGKWTGHSQISQTLGFGTDCETSALSSDGKIAIVAFVAGKSAVWIVTSEKFSGNMPPKAVIEASEDEIYWKDSITFDGRNSSDPDGSIAKYEWDFGDGDKATGSRVTHAFVKKYGSLVVKLTVTDDRGATASATKNITVLDQPPLPVMTTQPDVVYWQDTVYCDASGSSDPYGTIVKYEWDFGDGNTAVGKTVSHPYVNKYGDLQLKLTVTNNRDTSASATKTLKVNALYAANATFAKKKFRTLFLDRVGYEISWTANVKNTQAGYTVVKYRILRKTAADLAYTQVAEVDAAITVYRDLGIEQSTDYTYVVCTVDALGHVSPLDNL